MRHRDHTYVGQELALFRNARNWRAYWSREILPFLGNSVLEVGAGIGSVTRRLAENAEHWVALEPDPTLAGQIFDAGTSSSVEVKVGTVRDLSESATYDSIIYIDVLEHILDDVGELEYAARLLKPGGFLVILVPAHMALYSPFDKAIGHHRRYSRSSLGHVLPSRGRVRRVAYLDSVGLLASGMNRFFLRSSIPTERQILFWDQWMVPLSTVLDKLVRGKVGKSLLVVWENGTEDSSDRQELGSH